MKKELKGRTVAIFTVSAFGVIIAVNLFMAWNAVHTFPGLETRNSYVASQAFQTDRAAQVALGWTVEPDYKNGELMLYVRDVRGAPVRARNMRAIVGRPTHRREDQAVVMQWRGDHYAGAVDLQQGNWFVDVAATAADGTTFRQRLNEYVKAEI